MDSKQLILFPIPYRHHDFTEVMVEINAQQEENRKHYENARRWIKEAEELKTQEGK